jgi:hypothetical protein
MSESAKNGILKALFVAIKPIARSLLRFGIGYKEFSDIAKSAFVQVASEEYGLRGRPTNISRVAIMTGITRKEVGKLRDSNLDLVAEISIKESPVSVLLHHWSSDPAYLDDAGKPRDLKYEGSDSFVTLVGACMGDIPPGAMRTELKRIGCVSELEGKLLRLEKRHFVPSENDDRFVLGLESAIHSLGTTVAFNCDPDRQANPKFQRLVSVDGMPVHKLANIENVATVKLQKFSEDFDDFLSSEESQLRGESDNVAQVGIGLYYYELFPPKSKG